MYPQLDVAPDANHTGQRFAHIIRHGFSSNDAKSCLDRVGENSGLAGIAFRITAHESPWDALQKIATELSVSKLKATVRVTLAAVSPAQNLDNDAAIACRTADTMLASWLHSDRLSVFFDTFVDHDRGYFPRHGFVDRFCDSRAAGHVIGNLVEFLHDMPTGQTTIQASDSIRLIAVNGEPRFVVALGTNDNLFQALATRGLEPLTTVRLDSPNTLSIARAKTSKSAMYRQVTNMPLLMKVASKS